MTNKSNLRKRFKEEGFSISSLELEKFMEEIRNFVDGKIEELIYEARLKGKKRIVGI